MISKQTAVEVYEAIANSSDKDKAAIQLAKKRKLSIETIKRYSRYGANYVNGETPKQPESTKKTQRDKYLEQLGELPEEVLKAFVKSKNHKDSLYEGYTKIKKPSKTFTLGYFSDTHIGSKCFREDWFDIMVEDFNKHKVDAVVCSGDVTDGLYIHRPGHIFELEKLGFKEQKKYAIEQLAKIQQPFYTISGNHDWTYQKDMDANIVEEICDHLPNATYLGHDVADLCIGNIIIKLFHGQDGNSYALSYRAQKLVESFTGGTKPHILLCGHVHKTFWLPMCRNVEVFSGGAMSMQSKWMMSKKIENHSGYWRLTIESDDVGVVSVTGNWTPLFVEPLKKHYI